MGPPHAVRSRVRRIQVWERLLASVVCMRYGQECIGYGRRDRVDLQRRGPFQQYGEARTVVPRDLRSFSGSAETFPVPTCIHTGRSQRSTLPFALIKTVSSQHRKHTSIAGVVPF